MEVVKGAFYFLSLLYSFRDDLFQQEGLGTINALRLALVRNNQHAFAFGTWHSKRFLPRSEFTIGIIDTAKECAALASLSFHQFTAIGGTCHPNLQ